MITVEWLDGESKGYIDLLDEKWFKKEGKHHVGEKHHVEGPKGGGYEAQCDIRVKGSIADLDYTPYPQFNQERGMLLGVMRLQFEDENRKKVEKVLWKYSGEETFVEYETAVGNNNAEEKWTDEEFEAAVKAYLWMLDQEKHGKPYNKSKVRQHLLNGPLAARTKASIEYRMRNISAVLDRLSLPWLKGYKPANNVGNDGKKRIERILQQLHAYDPSVYLPTESEELLQERVGKLRETMVAGTMPEGQAKPEVVTTTTTRYARDPSVVAWVLEVAKGRCEACGRRAPFTSLSTGKPFLEVHHLKALGADGTDKPTNAVALCPNCHRRCHHSDDAGAFVENIYAQVLRLVRE